MKYGKCIDKIKKSSSESRANFNQTCHKASLDEEDLNFQMKGHTLFKVPVEIITKSRKYEVQKSSPEPLGQFQSNSAQSILG